MLRQCMQQLRRSAHSCKKQCYQKRVASPLPLCHTHIHTNSHAHTKTHTHQHTHTLSHAQTLPLAHPPPSALTSYPWYPFPPAVPTRRVSHTPSCLCQGPLPLPCPVSPVHTLSTPTHPARTRGQAELASRLYVVARRVPHHCTRTRLLITSTHPAYFRLCVCVCFV